MSPPCPNTSPRVPPSLPRRCLEMLYPLSLALPALLLLLLAVLRFLWPEGAQPSWLAGLQYRGARGALAWAATWQRQKLEQTTLLASQSQQQALEWCLRGASGSRGSLLGSTGVFPKGWEDLARRKETPFPTTTIGFSPLGSDLMQNLCPTPARWRWGSKSGSRASLLPQLYSSLRVPTIWP